MLAEIKNFWIVEEEISVDSFESCKTNYYRLGRNTTRGTKRTDGIYISFSQNVIVKLLATTTK